MSAATARYLRVMLTPRNPDGSPAEVWPSIAALSSNARHLAEVLSNLAYTDNNARTIPVPVLAQRMGKKDRMVQRAIAELAAAGVIAVDTGGGSHSNASTYRFPLAAPAHLVPTGVTGDTGDNPQPVSPATLTGVTSDTHKVLQVPVVTTTDAVPRGGEPWRQVIKDALAKDDARRAAEGRA